MSTPWTGPLKRLCCAVTVGLILGTAVPAAAASPAPQVSEVYVSMPGTDAPGPAAQDRIHVLKVGSARARQILVLAPGQFGAAGSLAPLARELAARLPDTQVWAVDRREQNLADLDGFRRSPDRAADYYLGGHYRARPSQTVPYVGASLKSLGFLGGPYVRARLGGDSVAVLG